MIGIDNSIYVEKQIFKFWTFSMFGMSKFFYYSI